MTPNYYFHDLDVQSKKLINLIDKTHPKKTYHFTWLCSIRHIAVWDTYFFTFLHDLLFIIPELTTKKVLLWLCIKTYNA